MMERQCLRMVQNELEPALILALKDEEQRGLDPMCRFRHRRHERASRKG